ncbi:GNAT family N-acetyltransferase [Clavibacter michiganensis]|uniref:GNAT family N-acetyltransferase n=1 Tax=Clavibacter michiganensis TaxID=28447 RepID=UPI0013662C57|nr:GNAT family N-acetyltransferase [Clavibacter michiganensis]MDO4017165.1 GNAT family N-acetyltransferase [Clavibacter michiganensis]MDO4037421.1 GNAT family N-acetyltransferase [Clavibacter michiganensis]MDO4039989.1 GNAT family N-acetyltransferase [Clavibacter michiganensis]MDO4049950.1 GNAT family N-acetyltransferase [Clavibacter michiganensis]MDO4059335.1 GNAT family N-acetyltransferase [Clavibacter michiganensis]
MSTPDPAAPAAPSFRVATPDDAEEVAALAARTFALRLRPEIELSKVYVEAGSHGVGVARPLMAETLRVARELAGERGLGADAGIWLGVNEHNARAIRFYERSGFHIVGTRSFRLSDAVETDHVMERALAAAAGE